METKVKHSNTTNVLCLFVTADDSDIILNTHDKKNTNPDSGTGCGIFAITIANRRETAWCTQKSVHIECPQRFAEQTSGENVSIEQEIRALFSLFLTFLCFRSAE